MAIDLGTANTYVYVPGGGIVLKEPSIVAVNTVNGQVVAVGTEAQAMLGRTPPGLKAVRPLKAGVIADFDMTERMLAHFIKKARSGSGWGRLRLVIGIPSSLTSVERRAVEDAAHRAKANEVYLVEEPVAAAMGANLPVASPVGTMVVDIGGGPPTWSSSRSVGWPLVRRFRLPDTRWTKRSCSTSGSTTTC